MPDNVQLETLEPGTVSRTCRSCCRIQPIVLERSVRNIYGEVAPVGYCASCTMVCAQCEALFPIGYGYTSSDGTICEACIELYNECPVCGNMERPAQMATVSDRDGANIRVCGTCYDERVTTCLECDAEHLGRRCPHCSGQLLPYDYRPELEFYDEGTTEARYYLGFEIEVEGGSNPPKEMPKWVFCKSDGSLDDGFEVVSHPLSPKWLRQHRGEVAGMLSKLSGAGFESYDTDTCGMHVHVSRSAFDGTFHLLKFLEMFYRWGGWVLIVSQRQEELLQRWANCGASTHDVYRKAKVKANSHEDRYTAVNLENDNTFEVRVFRGTLDPLSFFKNLQYVEAVVEFTRDASRRKVTPREFRAWVATKEKQYPDLVQWLRQNGHFDSRKAVSKKNVRSDTRAS